jgi:flagellar biosynthesis/type III secretory pathway protein FliH
MLAERIMEWTERWKESFEEAYLQAYLQGYLQGFQQGLQQGLQESLDEGRGVILRELEKRFGSLPEKIRRQVDAIGSIEEMMELSFRVGSASSLEDLELS